MAGDPTILNQSRNHNREINQSEFEAGVIQLTSRPRFLFIELTRACNLSCPMCRPTVQTGRRLHMADTILDQLIKEVLPYVECVDLRGSGESTLDPRLLPLIRELAADGIKVNLYTNLSTHRTNYWREMGGSPVNIAISVDAATPHLLEKIRRGISYKKFVCNLYDLQEGRSRSSVNNGLFFSAAIGDHNFQEIPGLIQLAAHYEVPLVRLNPLTLSTLSNPYSRIGVSHDRIEQLQKALLEAVEISRSSGVAIEIAASLNNSNTGGFDRCLHPWSYCVVEYDGRLVFCDHFVDNERAIMASLTDSSSFMDAWNSMQYQNIRKMHVEKDFSWTRDRGLECDWCYGNRFADCEADIDKRYQPCSLDEYLSQLELGVCKE